MDPSEFHPAFPQPPSGNTVLWRYLDDWKFEWLVKEKRLLMARSDRLGDPLEGTSPQGHKKWWQEQIAQATSEQERAFIRQNEEFIRSFGRFHYVSCWHVNTHQSEQMWDAYTSSACSVAIRTTYSLLKEALPDHILWGLVRYIDYSTADLPSLNIFQRITHKDLRYDFERELRGVATRPPSAELGQEMFDATFSSLIASRIQQSLHPVSTLRLPWESRFTLPRVASSQKRYTLLAASTACPSIKARPRL